MPAPKKNVAGNIVKAIAKKVIKGDTPAKANARGLKAANAKLSKGNAKAPFKGGMSGNVLKNSPPLREGRIRGGSMATLRRQEAAAKANKMTSNLKNTKPLENVPKGVSNRFDATNNRLAAEAAKKKKK